MISCAAINIWKLLRINYLTFPNISPIFAAQNRKEIPMLPTISFMRQSFHRFNQEYFQGTLPTPEFKISKSSKLYGYCRRVCITQADGTIEYRYTIACTKYYYFPTREIENIMLHEMCHLWVFINYPDTTEPSHGPIWQSIANRITVASNNKYIITPGSTCPVVFINPKLRRPPKKSSRPSFTPHTTYKPSFRHTLLRTILLLMLLVLFL